MVPSGPAHSSHTWLPRSAVRLDFCAGKREIARKNWEKAAQHLELVETVYSEAIPLLEACFRELGDYRRAYEYACKQRK